MESPHRFSSTLIGFQITRIDMQASVGAKEIKFNYFPLDIFIVIKLVLTVGTCAPLGPHRNRMGWDIAVAVCNHFQLSQTLAYRLIAGHYCYYNSHFHLLLHHTTRYTRHSRGSVDAFGCDCNFITHTTSPSSSSPVKRQILVDWQIGELSCVPSRHKLHIGLRSIAAYNFGRFAASVAWANYPDVMNG